MKQVVGFGESVTTLPLYSTGELNSTKTANPWIVFRQFLTGSRLKLLAFIGEMCGKIDTFFLQENQ